ncbi:MAG: DUF2333 family protein, partial [Pseudomonadota bacterium]
METLRLIWRQLTKIPKYVFIYLGSFLFIFICLYYPIGMFFMSNIDDDLDFKASKKFEIENGSHSVAIIQALIEREVLENRWVPNDPFFYPSHFLVRMPAFQRGMVSAISRFAVELSDQIGRSRSSSQTDVDLEKAAGLLKYSPNVWV